MKVKDMKSIIQDLDDDVEIEVNSILDEDTFTQEVFARKKHPCRVLFKIV